VLAGAVLTVGPWQQIAAASSLETAREKFVSPLATLEILGESVLERTIARLRAAQVQVISVLIPQHCPFSSRFKDPQLRVNVVKQPIDPALIDLSIREQAQAGIQNVLLMGLGAYVEVDFTDLLEFHREMGKPHTHARDNNGPLDLSVLDTSLGQSHSARSTLSHDRSLRSWYRVEGYVNRLADARDLRRLVVDSFRGRCSIRPRGREVKPGVWVGDGARVHRGARIVAPAYIGEGTRVRASVLITRHSNVERRCDIGHGTVVENSSVLPATFLGRGLSLTNALVAGDRYVHLGRNVTAKIADKRLIGSNSFSGWSFARNANPAPDQFPSNGENLFPDWPDSQSMRPLAPGADMTVPKPVIILELPETLTRGGVRRFLLEIGDHLVSDRPRLVFDFSQVRQIDSSGIEALLYCMEEVMKRDGDLKLAAIPSQPLMILELTRIDRLFEIFETTSEAVESFQHFPLLAQRTRQETWYSQSASEAATARLKLAI
jgi:anti-anti-sigma factor